MKENPKLLFDYIKKQKDKDKKISPLKIGEENSFPFISTTIHLDHHR